MADQRMNERQQHTPHNPMEGNADTITREYFDSLVFEERLIGSVEPSTEVTIFGRTLDTPVMTAALSMLYFTAEDGNKKVAEAMKRLGSAMWIGICQEEELHEIAGTGVNAVHIMKPYADDATVLHKIELSKRLGYMAIGMDIDHAFTKDGRFNTVPRTDIPESAKTVADIRRYVEACEGVPFIVKGVLSVTDAKKAVEAGASGIVLSHHHGTMPWSVPPVMVLPEIRKAVGDGVTIIVDSNIRDGYDAFKALALGADAVGIGRSVQQPLKEFGADGVYEYFKTITGQLSGIMARTGTASLAEKDPSVVRKIR